MCKVDASGADSLYRYLSDDLSIHALVAKLVCKREDSIRQAQRLVKLAQYVVGQCNPKLKTQSGGNDRLKVYGR